jgi:hypothetical protein
MPWDWRTSTERLAGYSREQRFSLTKPELLADEYNREGSWMVDLQIEHVSQFTNAPREQAWWQLPRRNSGGLMHSIFRGQARINLERRFSVRATNQNHHFFSPAVKPEIQLSVPEDSDAIRALLIHPRTRPSFKADIRYKDQRQEPTILTCRPSEKGANLAALIDLFGNFWTAKSFCERRFWRELFRKLAGYGRDDDETLRATVNDMLSKHVFGNDPSAAEKTGPLTEKLLHLVRGRLRGQHLTQNQCAELRSRIESAGSPDPLEFQQGNTIVHQQGHSPVSREEMHEGLDELLEIGVLRLGTEDTCPACKLNTWYHVNELRQHVTCTGCGAAHSLGATKRWSYSLNTLAQNSVSQGVIGVVYALASLASHSHGFFIFSPSLNLFRSDPRVVWREVDIICVAEGDLVIGEVNEGYVQENEFDKLAEIAEVLLPQRAIMFLPLDRAKQQWEELKKWATDKRAALGPKGVSVEIFTLPEY